MQVEKDRPVCRLRRTVRCAVSESVLVEKFFLNLHTGRSLTESTIQDAVLIKFDLLMMSTDLLETRRGL